MSDVQRQRDEIARDEEWFAGVCGRSAEIDAARIKRVVRIAIEEQWLAGQVSHDAPAELSARTRRAVREALLEAQGGAGNQGRNRVIRLWAWVGSGLAAAAAITFAVLGPWNTTPQSVENELSFAAVFEEFQDDGELDQELNRLRDAFLELDQTVAQGWGEDFWGEGVDDASAQSEDGV